MSRVRLIGVLGRAGRWTYLGLIAAFLTAPMTVVIGVSLNRSRRMSFPPIEPGFGWYRVFIEDPAWRSALEASLLVAGLATLIAMSVALPLGYAFWRYGDRVSRLLTGLGAIPFMLPTVVMSIVFLLFWSSIGHAGQVEDIAASHAVVFLAVPLLTVSLGFGLIDRSLVEAARSLGAGEADIFRTVVLPMLRPYIASGLIFVFVLSLNEYIIAYMVAGFSLETLPVKVFNSLRLGFEPTMCVGATLFLLLTLAAFLLVAVIGDLPKLLGADPKQP